MTSGLAGPGSGTPIKASFGLALIVEAALISGAILYLSAHRDLPPQPRPPMMVSLEKLPPAPQPAPAPKPEAQPEPKPQPKPKPVARPKPVVHHTEAPQPIALAASQPTASTFTVPAQPAPAAAAAPADPDLLANFEAQLRAAIQAALVYPPAARMMHAKGQARVAFDYLDGAISNILLVSSSGMDMLDRAGLAAVAAAQVPPPPPALSHQRQHLTLWVEFRTGP